MGVRLQRHKGRIDTIDPGQFMTDPTKHTPATMITTIICCPACSFVNTLTDRHVVDKSGRVTPAYKCPSETCSFFDWIELESWGEPA